MNRPTGRVNHTEQPEGTRMTTQDRQELPLYSKLASSAVELSAALDAPSLNQARTRLRRACGAILVVAAALKQRGL